MRMVYVLSDGQVGNDDVILKAARRSLGHNRIYTVGIGAAPNRHLLDRLAGLGRGFASYLAPADDPAELATRLTRKTTLPYLTDLRIDWGGLQVTEVDPARLPDVHAGEPLVVVARYSEPGEAQVTLHGRVAGRRTSTELQVNLPAERHRPEVGLLWARRRIARLMGSADDPDADSRKAVEELGLRFGLATAYTSFVAVDEQRVVSAGGPVHAVEQPAALPAGTPTSPSRPAEQITLASLPPLPPPGGGQTGTHTPRRRKRRRRRRWKAPRIVPRGGGDIDPFSLGLLGALLTLGFARRRRDA